jgi:hypothetical protein
MSSGTGRKNRGWLLPYLMEIWQSLDFLAALDPMGRDAFWRCHFGPFPRPPQATRERIRERIEVYRRR